jgi:hypothetical protein
MAEACGQFLPAWDRFVVSADEYHELDEKRVLVLGRALGRG